MPPGLLQHPSLAWPYFLDWFAGNFARALTGSIPIAVFLPAFSMLHTVAAFNDTRVW
jgi:hypothetical protein